MSIQKPHYELKEDFSVPNDRRAIKNRPTSARATEAQSTQYKKSLSGQFPSFRPVTGKSSNDLNNFFKNNLKPSNADRERLYEENLSLKIKSNFLQEENTKLKTKINQIENDLNRKEEQSENALVKMASRTHLVPNLKLSIKDLKDQIKSKEDEISKLRKNVKNTKMVEIDVEIQSYIDECTRLRHHLEEVMTQKKITYESLEYEERLYRQNIDINNLRQENQEYSYNLERAREEMIFVKEKISMLEHPNQKKKSNKATKQEISRLRTEILEMKEKLETNKEDFRQREENLKFEADNLVKSNEGIEEKIQNTELKLKEQSIILDQLQSQIVNHEKDFKRSQTIMVMPLRVFTKRKLPNPPKLFRRINQVITKKNMMLSVFLSLMDKNNNGFIDFEEIFQCMSSHGRKIKRKDIIESIKILKLPTSSIPISIMEEQFDNFLYTDVPSPESSEEIVEVPKKRIERLSYAAPHPVMITNDPLIPTVTHLPNREIKKVLTVKKQDVEEVLEDIVWQMKILKRNKNKLLSVLFGNDIDVDELITVEVLCNMLRKSVIKFEDPCKTELFARFLLEPEKTLEITEDQLKELKGNILNVCKRISANIKDWEIYEEHDITSTMKTIEMKLNFVRVALKENCIKADTGQTGTLTLAEFRKVLESLDETLSEKMWDIWAICLYPSKSLNYLDYFLKIGPKAPDISLKLIANRLHITNTSPESIFSVSSQGMITAEGFIEGVAALGVDLTNQDLLELLESIRFKGKNSFTLMVHINDLRELLARNGFHSQTISSSSSESASYEGDFS